MVFKHAQFVAASGPLHPLSPPAWNVFPQHCHTAYCSSPNPSPPTLSTRPSRTFCSSLHLGSLPLGYILLSDTVLCVYLLFHWNTSSARAGALPVCPPLFTRGSRGSVTFSWMPSHPLLRSTALRMGAQEAQSVLPVGSGAAFPPPHRSSLQPDWPQLRSAGSFFFFLLHEFYPCFPLEHPSPDLANSYSGSQLKFHFLPKAIPSSGLGALLCAP